MTRILSALLVGASVLGASHADAQVLCRFDAECGLGEVCVSGTCGLLAQPGASATCPTGQCVPPHQTAGRTTTADGSVELALEPPMEDQRNWKRNTTLLALGGISVGVGTIGLVVGGITKVLAKHKDTVICEDAHCRAVNHDERVRLNTTGWIGLVGGGVMLVGGIPLIIVGAKKRPVDTSPPSASVEALLGPTSGRIVVAF